MFLHLSDESLPQVYFLCFCWNLNCWGIIYFQLWDILFTNNRMFGNFRFTRWESPRVSREKFGQNFLTKTWEFLQVLTVTVTGIESQLFLTYSCDQMIHIILCPTLHVKLLYLTEKFFLSFAKNAFWSRWKCWKHQNSQ